MKLEFTTNVRRHNNFILNVAETCETETLGIVGPSGSGKSTLLDSIAGIEKGSIRLDGVDLSTIPPQKRNIGYLTQDPLLFPHMNVRENLLYSPRADGLSEVVESLGISHLLERMPGKLSGGEKRRVALARAILSRPRILLLDEPFGGLDETLRREAMSLLDGVKRFFKIPIVLVSHLADEVIGLTEWTIRMESGSVIARGPSETVLNASETRIDNYFVGTVTGHNRVLVKDIELTVGIPEGRSGSVRMACYAHEILLSRTRPADISARNIFEATITTIGPAGHLTLVAIDKPSWRILITPEAHRALSLSSGARVFVIAKASSIEYLGSAELSN